MTEEEFLALKYRFYYEKKIKYPQEIIGLETLYHKAAKLRGTIAAHKKYVVAKTRVYNRIDELTRPVWKETAKRGLLTLINKLNSLKEDFKELVYDEEPKIVSLEQDIKSKIKNQNMNTTKKPKFIKGIINLDEDVADSLISGIEGIIAENKKKQADMQESLATKKQVYDRAQAEWDVFQAYVDKNQKSLEALHAFKTGAKEIKDGAAYKSISNTRAKSKGPKRKSVKWMKEAVELLNKRDEFLSVDAVYNHILLDKPDIAKSLENIDTKPLYKIKNYLKNMAILKNGGLLMHNDKIGLQDWFIVNEDGTFTPKAEKLNIFMAANAITGSGQAITI